MSEDETSVELRERGGFVGRELRYRAPLATLSERLRALVLGLPAGPGGAPCEATNVPSSTLLVIRQGLSVEVDARGVEPDLLEELLGVLRSSPVPK